MSIMKNRCYDRSCRMKLDITIVRPAELKAKVRLAGLLIQKKERRVPKAEAQ